MKYKSTEEAHIDHIDNYRSDGYKKGKGTMHSSDFHRVQFVVENIKPCSNVLDVGCNGGTIGIILKRDKECYVNGIDIVPELVAKAVKRGIFATVGVAEDLQEFEDESFDAVICAEVLEHLYDPEPAIREAHRVLKPGGKYVVTIPHPESRMSNSDNIGDYHQQVFSMEILDTLFHTYFDQGNVTFKEIPYTKNYSIVNKINPEMPQWIGLSAIK